ncbi:MAG: PQQ-binding-like beta-propeller repeat protein [Pirellulaceae bacterium]|nr:PQQ-binding-like beta-propeller repeat protein [Pirellulaceae bacterium]
MTNWQQRIGTIGLAVVAIGLGVPSGGRAEPGGSPSPVERQARTILETAGLHGGLIVHLCRDTGDTELTAALRLDDRFTVHGLMAKAGDVADARRRLSDDGVYGAVSIHRLIGSELPYSDNLINLVVAADPDLVPMPEILRVLAPGGVASVRHGGDWAKTVKPWPEGIDEWTHYLYDATGNAVAADELVGPPRCLQWTAPPLWLRSHETPSGFESLVSGDGRVFYFLDEGLIGITDQRLPERWSLVCRDAFNGRLLWKRPLGDWGWPEWARDRFAETDWTEIRGARTVVPEENQRCLVVDGDRLYATLAYRAPLSILNAASGELLATVTETAPVKEILVADGFVLVHSQDAAEVATAQRRGQRDAEPSTLRGIAADTGKIVWQRPMAAIASMMLAVEGGRVVCQAGPKLACLRLSDGEPLWQVDGPKARGRTLIAHDGVVVLYVQNAIEARDATSGELLWRQDDVPPSAGSESPDLFITAGSVYRGLVPVNDAGQPVGKSEHAMAVAYDLRTGQVQRQIVVEKLRSPEHHHRCYRNKATTRYLISGMEGAEFMDLVGEDHCQNNWLRGACKLGIMPSNGLLYVPPDQCFCQPGAKVLGFAAIATEQADRQQAIPDDQRLERGPAFGLIDASGAAETMDDWPTFRRDSARHATTLSAVSPNVRPAWRTELGNRLTAPVAAGDRVYVAAPDAHTVYALDAATGETAWKFFAGARVDSPPTIDRGRVLFGSADGCVYCLRAADGQLAWRFTAAPNQRLIGHFDQIESVWPVHGSVLLHNGLAYFTAGRSTYLDGGVRVFALDPDTGEVRHQTTLSGPFPDVQEGERDVAFYVPGANSDVLVAEGGFIYMRQKKLTSDLREVEIPVLSSKGEADAGLHVFSTSGLLDDSWYNRTFWMYSKRWPGFQLANQAPKTGQLLVVDDQQTYALRVFYRRNVHSPMFFPGKEGYLLFADRNSTEPQIMGDQGARPPIQWLPQSHIPREGNPGLDSVERGFGADKGIGYTRAEPPVWTRWLPIRVRGMVKAGDVLFVAGPPDELDPADPYAAFEGRRGANLAAIDSRDGTSLGEYDMDVPPIFDGLIAARGRLLISLEDGSVACWAGQP